MSVDGAGIVWVNEINTDTVVRLDPSKDALEVVKLPTPNEGIRKMIVDARGRLWYMGSHSGNWESSSEDGAAGDLRAAPDCAVPEGRTRTSPRSTSKKDRIFDTQRDALDKAKGVNDTLQRPTSSAGSTKSSRAANGS